MTRKTLGYRLFIWGSLIFSLFLLWRLNNNILTQVKYIPADDYVRHWAAGKSFLKGDDPYSPSKLQVYQDQATGPQSRKDIISTIFIPPWSFLIVAPFAILNYPLSRLAWLIFSIILLIISAELLWKVYDGPSQKKWLSWIFVFLYFPTIYLLEDGQTTCLVLLGLAAFLYFERLHRYWLGGTFIALITIKPQLTFLFWPAIVLWSIKRKNFSVCFGSALAILLASILMIIINPQIFEQYFSHIRFNSPVLWGTPTIGGYLRYFFLGVENFWPQYIGPSLGAIWFILYWSKKNQHWDWASESPILSFMSVLTSLYGWSYDQVVLQVGIIKAGCHLTQFQKKVSWTLMAVYFFMNFINMFLHRFLDDFWFYWFAPAIFIWYLVIIAKKSNEKTL